MRLEMVNDRLWGRDEMVIIFVSTEGASTLDTLFF